MAFSIKGDGNMILGAYIVMNLIGLIVMKLDKERAKKHQYRISENTLWLVAIFGGAVGTTAGMQLFRHKTKHVNFKIGFPILAAAEVILLSYFFTL
ncbi:uncharacterized membrane protein YsdA (DUF1294 family) [Bacillus niacini]|uniref:Uncharacterized membrane protein YsdA (DUF1294 family) n=2 Tax=Neobacillus TaxID=2675232 RepID=A0A852TG05_9BACI|nr:uncharacterized membrane protein YsdA (DUF1294 family) [Neobacillus niacini]